VRRIRIHCFPKGDDSGPGFSKLIFSRKFFGKPPGTKPPAPEQSKLLFSSQTRQNEKKNAKQDAQNGALETPLQSAVESPKDIIMIDEEDPTESRPTSQSTSPKTRKRQPPEDEGADGASEEEPPSKKQRVQPALRKSKKVMPKQESDGALEVKSPSEKPKSSRVNRKSVTFDAEDVDENVKPTKILRKATPKKIRQVKKTGNEGEAVADEEVLTPSNPPAKTIIDLSNETPAESMSEHDGEVQSEDDQPEAAAEAREKVQSTLTAKGKDPYPDWRAGDPVPYAALCTTFSLIEMTTKRLEISAHCSLFLRQVLRLTPNDLLPTIQLMINKLAADYSGIELGIGESLIMKAIGETTGRSLPVIKADQNEIGDLGLVAAKSRSNQPTMFKPKPLTVRAVHEGLMSIATVEGQGSQGRKIAGIKKLLSAADAHLAGKGSKGIDITKDKGGSSETKFIIRTLEGKMRLGLADKTVLVALAHAVVIHETAQKGTKIPSTEQMAKGETVLKSVYR